MLKKAALLSLLSISLLGCTSKEVRHLKEIESNGVIKYLTEAEILFAYENITGFDSSGPLYYVLDFTNKEKEQDFVDQFYNPKTKENSLNDGPNVDFELKVNDFVQQWIGMDYLTFEEDYKIDFEAPYSYYIPSLDRGLEFALIYRAETHIVNFLYLKQ